MRKRKSGAFILITAVLISMFSIDTLGMTEDWECISCGSMNNAENHFCGYCGTAMPQAAWICPDCSAENNSEYRFCASCGSKRTTEELTGEPSAEEAQASAYGEHMLYWDGYTYVTGDNGIYRIDSNNEFDLIRGSDSIANGFFAAGESVYFMKHTTAEERDCLYVFNTKKEDAEILCTAESGSILVGANQAAGAVYFLEPTEQTEFGGGSSLIRYHLDEDKKETVASGIGTARFWNGALVISGAASDIRPVQLMILGSDGNSGLLGENCSQSFYIDGNALYYIKYDMTSETDWNKAYICRVDPTGNYELCCMEGDYITPYIVSTIEDDILVSCYVDGRAAYITVNSKDGSQYEMELPDGASYVSIFYDEYGNRYYYANNSVYIWRGAGYEKIAALASDEVMLGIAGNYAYCWRYNNGNHPSLFQHPIS